MGDLKIAHVLTRLQSGGSEENILAAIRAELADGHEVHLVAGRVAPERIPADVIIHVIPQLARAIRPLADVQALCRLRRLFGRVEVDVVHTHQSKAGVIGRLAAYRRAKVVVHTVHMAAFGPGYSRSASIVYRAAERLGARFCDLIVCVGTDLAAAYAKANVGRRDQYLVIRSPIDVDSFLEVRKASDAVRAEARRRFGVPEGASAVLVAGSLEPRKRVDLVIRELADLLRRGDAVLLVAGDGPDRGMLETLAASHDVASAVRFLGHVRAMPEVFCAADVFVHASRVEGVPQVVVQAAAAGSRIVATDVEGLRELGNAPIAIVSRNGRGLADSVAAAFNDPRPPADPRLFETWRPEAVAVQRASLWRLIAESMSSAGAAAVV
jgi:glycosyltransferase involved in cell wall biosynthesis